MIQCKFYECAICKRLVDNGVKGEERFFGTRKDVRKHLHDIHHLKHIKNKEGVPKKDLGQSQITLNTIAKEIKFK
jgi:hypothetical protein